MWLLFGELVLCTGVFSECRGPAHGPVRTAGEERRVDRISLSTAAPSI